MEQTQRPAFNAKQQSYRSDLSNVLSPLFNGAITVAQLAQISDDVVDASIVYATPAAAQLFGFDHAEQLIGQYISHLHHPEDALITRHYALARIRNDWHPNPYPMRILRGTTQELVPVFKHVRQVTIDGVLTWITVHTPFDFSLPFVMPVTPTMLNQAGGDDEQQLLGRMHVAYMDRLLHSRHDSPGLADLVANRNDYLTYTQDSGNLYPTMTESRGTGELIESIITILAQAQHNRPHHVCLRCAWPWYSNPTSSSRPNKCPKCGDKNWDRPRIYGT